jgi:hypothetical protein
MSEARFAMVSEWMTNGNLNQFVAAHPDVNRFDLVGLPFALLSPSLDMDWLCDFGSWQMLRGA